MLDHLLAFAAIAAVVIVVPGPDTALTVRNTLVGGRHSGIATAAGVAAGQATWAVCTAAGLAAVLHASQPAFTALRLAGAVYLVYLGAHSLVGAVRGRGSSTMHPQREAARHAARSFRQGLVSNLANPKMAVFFISLLPPFAGVHASFLGLASLGALFAVFTLAWLALYATAAARMSRLLRRGPARRALDALTGAALVGLGLRVAADAS